MGRVSILGELEQMVLMAVLRLDDAPRNDHRNRDRILDRFGIRRQESARK